MFFLHASGPKRLLLLPLTFEISRIAVFAFTVVAVAIACGVAFALWQDDVQNGLGISTCMFMFIGFSSGLYGFDDQNGLIDKPSSMSWAYDSKCQYDVEEDEKNGGKHA
jgi:hypothetical protein